MHISLCCTCVCKCIFVHLCVVTGVFDGIHSTCVAVCECVAWCGCTSTLVYMGAYCMCACMCVCMCVCVCECVRESKCGCKLECGECAYTYISVVMCVHVSEDMPTCTHSSLASQKHFLGTTYVQYKTKIYT